MSIPPPVPPSEPVRAFSWSFYPIIWAQANLIRLMAPAPAMKDKIPTDIEVVHTSIPSRDKGRTIKADAYRAKGVKPSGKILLNWHGSGFILHRHSEDKTYCSYIAGQLREAGVTVYDLDYRKAPESPFPAGIEDVEDAILHFARLPTTTNLAVGGFSAGSMFAIAASATTKPILAGKGGIPVSSITAFYPASDMRPGIAKRTAPVPKARSGATIAPWVGNIFTTALCVDPDSMYDKRSSLILHKADELPPHFLIITGNADSLHEDSVDFINNLNNESPPHPDAKMISIPEESHAWDKKPLCKESFESRDFAYSSARDHIKIGLDIA
ncbi:hypothetical protein OC845_003428 [Tilletia horrida]|nr:hypothetical protein OC845_003428 [Tilletia horrida]